MPKILSQAQRKKELGGSLYTSLKKEGGNLAEANFSQKQSKQKVKR